MTAARRVEVTKQRLAAFFDCTPRRITQLVSDHGLPQVSRGKFDLLAASHFYLRYLADVIAARGGGDGLVQRLRQQNKIALAKVRTERMRARRVVLDQSLIDPRALEAEIRAIEAETRAVLLESLMAVAPKAAMNAGMPLKELLKEAVSCALIKAAKKSEIRAAESFKTEGMISVKSLEGTDNADAGKTNFKNQEGSGGSSHAAASGGSEAANG